MNINNYQTNNKWPVKIQHRIARPNEENKEDFFEIFCGFLRVFKGLWRIFGGDDNNRWLLDSTIWH
jgi:hypothetical protein